MEEEKLRKESLLEKSALFLDLPMDLVASLPNLTMMGDRELRLFGYKGILSLGRNEIHVDGGKWVLEISGRDLEIRGMRKGELLLTGFIQGLRLL